MTTTRTITIHTNSDDRVTPDFEVLVTYSPQRGQRGESSTKANRLLRRSEAFTME